MFNMIENQIYESESGRKFVFIRYIIKNLISIRYIEEEYPVEEFLNNLFPYKFLSVIPSSGNVINDYKIEVN